MRKVILIFFLLVTGLFRFSVSYAQSDRLEKADYFIRNFSKKEYKGVPQILSVTQDNEGSLLVGAAYENILIYNGNSWQNFSVNGSFVRELLKASDGTIYAGTDADFGYLKKDTKGRYVYYSLGDKRANHDTTPVSEIWRIHETDEGIVFQSFNALYLYKNNQVKTIPATGAGFHFSFCSGNRLFIKHRELGLLEWSAGKLITAPYGELFIPLVPVGMEKSGDNYWVATKDHGLLKYNPLAKQSGEALIPVKTKLDPLLKSAFIYKMLRLHDGNLALGTFGKGLVIINQEGELVHVLNKDNGLQNEQIFSLFQDNEANIWCGLGEGISRVEYASPVLLSYSTFKEKNIVESFSVIDHCRMQATRLGLWISEAPYQTYRFIEETKGYVYEIKNLSKQQALVAGEAGVFLVSSEKNAISIKQITDLSCKSMAWNTNFTRLYLSTPEGLAELEIDRNFKVKNESYPEKLSFESSALLMENKGILWGSRAYYGAFSYDITTKKVTLYDTLSGLPSSIQNLPFLYNNSCHFLTTDGLFGRNALNKLFKRINSCEDTAVSKRQYWRAMNDSRGLLWLQTRSHTTGLTEAGFIDKEKNWNSGLMKRVPNMVNNCFYEEDGLVWAGGDEGLYMIKPDDKQKELRKKAKPVFALIIAGINDTLNLIPDDVPQLAYSNNNLVFSFFLPSFQAEENIQYATRLEGMEESWTLWSGRFDRSFNKLSPGKYVFYVKAMNAFGEESAECSYAFTILPPWYLSWWAYLLYALSGLLTVYIIVQLSVRRLKKAKIKLEAMVSERTAEVVKQKDEILVQKHELEKKKQEIEQFNEELSYKNKEITDSIQYAKKIQEAILVEEELIYRRLPEAFILYMPRDIVSGDFYWFYDVQGKEGWDCLIAAADCTGHGVPGAFMSMIGSTLLNEIVSEKRIHQPGQILEQLNIEVRKSLKQDEEHSQSRDGMDIALCAVNVSQRKIKYAGAMRPLWTIRSGEFQEFKATKSPIGGKQQEEFRQYEVNELQFNAGDTAYLFSDGYADQFGGEKGKKFMTKRFQELLLSVQCKNMKEQKELLRNAFVDWKGNNEQVDDVLVIGIRF